MTTEAQRHQNARHEAAHVVCALHFGIPIAWVSCRRTEYQFGEIEARFAQLPSPEGRRAVEEIGVATAAGIAADVSAGNRPLHDIYDVTREGTDAEKIASMAVAFGEDRALFLARCVRRAADILAKHGGALEDGYLWGRITEALFARHRLTGRQVRALMRESDG